MDSDELPVGLTLLATDVWEELPPELRERVIRQFTQMAYKVVTAQTERPSEGGRDNESE